MKGLRINKKCVSLHRFMANDYFRFKKFTVSQTLCAMKVGTDGTLLGAWAEGGRRILDVGTGTGLIALMMAQRFPESAVTAIDIDEGAVSQALKNVAASPFAARISVEKYEMQAHRGQYDAIVCNPPFFEDALLCPDDQRRVARHAVTLSFAELMASAWQLLSDDGVLSVVIPFDYRERMESEAILKGFFKCREWAVRTTPTKPPRRYLLAFRKHNAGLERQELVIGSDAYIELTKDFYL